LTVDKVAEQFLKAHPAARAMSIGVYKDGQTYTFNYGVLRPGTHQKPTAQTLYPIASITKTFVGTLLAQAELDGKLKLDDDIRKYLDGSYPNLEFEGMPIRVKDIIDHRSGLPFLMPDVPEGQAEYDGDKVPWTARVARLEKNYSREDFMADLHKVKLSSKPGEKASYSNAGATLAAFILERVYDKPFEVLLREKILEPLGMDDTSIVQTRLQESATAPGYDGKGRLMPRPPVEFGAAAGLKSNVHDMLAYAAWNLAETDPAVRLAHKPIVVVPPEVTGLKMPFMTGLNWQELQIPDDHDSRRLIWQSGGMDGFNSYCALEPELKLAVVVLFNEEDNAITPAHEAVVNDILTGIDARSITLP